MLTYTLTVTTGRLYSFRHRSFNYNGASPYSPVLQTYACVDPQPPGTPQWVTSSTISITLTWSDPIDNGGCPIIEYQLFRDTGLGYGDQVINQIH